MCGCAGATAAAAFHRVQEELSRDGDMAGDATRDAPRAVAPQAGDRPDVPLMYIGSHALLLKGPLSRRIYALTPGMPPLTVDARDADPFLNSPLFTRAAA